MLRGVDQSVLLPLSSRARRAGGALVLVMMVLVLSAAMVFSVQLLQRQRQVELQFLDAEAVLRHSLLELLQEGQAVLRDATNLVQAAAAESWATPREGLRENGVSYHFALRDAQSRFDMNNLSLPGQSAEGRRAKEILAELLVQCDYLREEDLVEALGDWMDADEDGVRERRWYREQHELRSPVNRPLFSIAELEAFSPRSAQWLEPRPRTQNRIRRYEGNFPELITVLPRSRRLPVPVNINSAAPEILLALFGEEERAWVDTILQVRANGPIQDLGLFLKSMAPRQRERLRRWLTVESNFFELQARTYWKGYAKELHATLYRSLDGEVEVLGCRW